MLLGGPALPVLTFFTEDLFDFRHFHPTEATRRKTHVAWHHLSFCQKFFSIFQVLLMQVDLCKCQVAFAKPGKKKPKQQSCLSQQLQTSLQSHYPLLHALPSLLEALGRERNNILIFDGHFSGISTLPGWPRTATVFISASGVFLCSKPNCAQLGLRSDLNPTSTWMKSGQTPTIRGFPNSSF